MPMQPWSDRATGKAVGTDHPDGAGVQGIGLCPGDLVFMDIEFDQARLFKAVEGVDVSHVAIVVKTEPPTIAHATGANGVRYNLLCELLSSKTSRGGDRIGRVKVFRVAPHDQDAERRVPCSAAGDSIAAEADRAVGELERISYPDVHLSACVTRSLLTGFVVNNPSGRLWLGSLLRYFASAFRVGSDLKQVADMEGRAGTASVFCTEFVAGVYEAAHFPLARPKGAPDPDWQRITDQAIESLLQDVENHERAVAKRRGGLWPRVLAARRVGRRLLWRSIRLLRDVPRLRTTVIKTTTDAVEWLQDAEPEWFQSPSDELPLGFITLYDILYSPTLTQVGPDTSATDLRKALCDGPPDASPPIGASEPSRGTEAARRS